MYMAMNKAHSSSSVFTASTIHTLCCTTYRYKNPIVLCSLANYSVAYEETQSNRVSDFRDFVCSLFPKAILFNFYITIDRSKAAFLLQFLFLSSICFRCVSWTPIGCFGKAMFSDYDPSWVSPYLYTFSIGTLKLLTILVLKFEQVHCTTCDCV